MKNKKEIEVNMEWTRNKAIEMLINPYKRKFLEELTNEELFDLGLYEELWRKRQEKENICKCIGTKNKFDLEMGNKCIICGKKVFTEDELKKIKNEN